MELYQANIGSYNLVVDLHYYNLFDTFFINMSSADNIQFIYNGREAQLQALNSANGPLVFIGTLISTSLPSINRKLTSKCTILEFQTVT